MEYTKQNDYINLVLNGEMVAVTGLATTSDKLKKDPGEKVGYQALPRMAGKPIVRSTGISGGLRRALSDEVLRATRACEGKDYPYASIHAWLLNRQGGVASFGVPLKINDKTNEAAEIRRSNPVLAIFGAGGLPGKIAIEPAIPKGSTKDIVARDHGFRSDDIRRDAGITENLPSSLLDEYVLLRFGAQSQDNTIAAFGVLEARRQGDGLQGNPVLTQAYAAVNGESPDVETADDDKKFTSIINPYGGYEYFVPGTRFQHRISLIGLTRDEAAMAIGALYAFSRRPVIGGHLRNGLGHVSLSYRVMTFDDDPCTIPQADGDLNITSRTDLRDEENGPRPAFASTSPVVNDLLEHFLALAKAGFPGMNFNAGVNAEFKGLESRKDAAETNKKTKTSTAKKTVKADTVSTETADKESA